ncbi:MAG: cysteine--tRNA ligase, partial [Patescibacteria group bacterium]
EDLLKRALLLNGYKVKHVMNITDVGHLEHDSDTGRDKVEEAAKSKKKSVWDLAREYEEIFKHDLASLNILFPQIFPRATEHIEEQIAMIKKLEKKGLTYRTSDGVYFDTSKFKNYGVLVKEKLKGLKAGARTEEREKKNQTDFALWKFSPRARTRQMEWPSPWGMGFPGWHIECSAMSIKYLGMPIDIHAGGVDHIHPHHTNEIAQTEGAWGKKFVNYWIHSEFLRINEGRMGKSEGNAITLGELEEKGFSPLDFRYFTLTAHYRSPLSFSWEALKAARTARLKLEDRARNAYLAVKPPSKAANVQEAKRLEALKKQFTAKISDDLDAPGALALLWKFLDSKTGLASQYAALLFADHILGLNIEAVRPIEIPPRVASLVKKREDARKAKDWARADEIRKEIESLGFSVEDTPQGPKVKRKSL